MIKKKAGFILAGFILLSSMVLVAGVSAEVIFSQLNPIYSLGEEFTSEINVGESEIGYMDINLVCDLQTQNLYRGVPESKTIILKRKLIPTYIGALSGNCYLESIYGEEISKSQNFKISKEINILLISAQKEYEVGNFIKIKGTATKESSGLVGEIQNGFIEAKLAEEVKVAGIVKKGQFEVDLTIPNQQKKGDYNLAIKVFEKDSQGDILSISEINYAIIILQKPGSIDVAIDFPSITPGENLKLIPILKDLAGEEMENNLLVQIKDSQQNIIYQGVSPANQELSIPIATTTPNGSANIVIQKENLTAEKIVYIKELKKITSEIKNQTMYLTNIGNVPYNQMIEIKIGQETVFKEVSIALNETKAYNLYAPSGDYEIQIKDELNNVFNHGGISITGNAISVEEAKTRIDNFMTENPIIWVFIGLVILGFLVATFMKHRKTLFLKPFHEHKQLRSFKEEKGFKLLLPSKANKKENSENEFKEIKHEKKNIRKLTTVSEKDIKTNKNVEKIKLQGEIREAKQAGVLHGTKQRCGVIAIKFKNQAPEGMAMENLMKALELAYKNKGTSYFSGNNVFVIFAPVLTRTFKNEDKTIQIAQDIERELHSHNKLFREKLDFGIGVNVGDLIVKKEEQVLKFASIDKTIPLAKKIAELSNGEVLLSKDIHVRTMNNVKADKQEIPGESLEIFKIKRIVDQNAADKFIKEFMRRN